MNDKQGVGSLFRVVRTSTPVIPFNSGNVSTVELPRSFLHKRVFLRLSGSANIAVAAATASTSEIPLGLIKQIELIADGRKTLWRIGGRDAYRLAHILNGKKPELVAPALGVGATQTFSASIPIDHQALRMVKPIDSVFDPRPYEKLELRITWGTVSDILTPGGGGTVAINATTQIDVQVEQTTQGEEHIIFNDLLTFDETDVSATTANKQIVLPRSGLLRGLLFRTDRDGIAVDNLINKISLKSDNNFSHMDLLQWATVQQDNLMQYQLDGGGGSQGQITGYAFVDLTEDGRLPSGINTWALNELKLILDVTRTSGTEIIRVTEMFYEPRG